MRKHTTYLPSLCSNENSRNTFILVPFFLLKDLFPRLKFCQVCAVGAFHLTHRLHHVGRVPSHSPSAPCWVRPISLTVCTMLGASHLTHRLHHAGCVPSHSPSAPYWCREVAPWWSIELPTRPCSRCVGTPARRVTSRHVKRQRHASRQIMRACKQR